MYLQVEAKRNIEFGFGDGLWLGTSLVCDPDELVLVAGRTGFGPHTSLSVFSGSQLQHQYIVSNSKQIVFITH